MSRHQSLSDALAAMASVGSSKHRSARVLRFIYRHPKPHGGVIAALRKRDRRHARRADARFYAMQRANAPVGGAR